jgi:hypothetical protein
MSYDSSADILRHIARVQELLNAFASEIMRRGQCHDASKLGPVEKPIRDANPPNFKNVFGSPEARAHIRAIQVAVDHHYTLNSHHPEHYGEQGVYGMDLADLVEMFFDWKAAGEPYVSDTIADSIAKNAGKYDLDPQIVAILTNTARRLGWIEPDAG